jgi:hypothetical protein
MVSKLAIQFDEDGIIDEMRFEKGLDLVTAFGVLYALNPDILSSWKNDAPFTGALTASRFNVFHTVKILEKLFTSPKMKLTHVLTLDVV